MKKQFISIILLTGIITSQIFAQETSLSQDIKIAEDELTSIGDKSIRFISYNGPYEFTNTLDQIQNIGRLLAKQIDIEQSSQASVGNKYRVLHIVTPEITEGLDADIFILDETAAVDHITNLRHILSGYLEAAYGLTSQDAYLIAEFATYYNAVYRGNDQMVQERYKAPVNKPLVKEKIGLGTHFSKWPGQTQMIIPLRKSSDALKVDTGPITDEDVIDEMRKESDKGMESRQAMVELRENEQDKEQQALDERRRKLEEEQKKLEEEKKKSDSDATEEEKRELAEKQTELDREQVAIEESQKEIDERIEDVMGMREGIAEDKNQAIAQEDAADDSKTFQSAETELPVWVITVDSDGGGIPFGRVIKYNAANGKKMAVSQVTAVRGRTMIMLPDAVLIIAGKKDETSVVRPMLLKRDNLETLREGEDDVFPGSQLTSRGSDIYLVTNDNNKWKLGKFTTELQRTAISTAEVAPWSSIFFENDHLYIQGTGGEIFKLNSSDLSTVDQFR